MDLYYCYWCVLLEQQLVIMYCINIKLQSLRRSLLTKVICWEWKIQNTIRTTATLEVRWIDKIFNLESVVVMYVCDVQCGGLHSPSRQLELVHASDPLLHRDYFIGGWFHLGGGGTEAQKKEIGNKMASFSLFGDIEHDG